MLSELWRDDNGTDILLSETHFRYNTEGRKTEEIVFDPQDGQQGWQASGNYAATPLTRTLISYWTSGNGGASAGYAKNQMLKTIAQHVGWQTTPLSATTYAYDEYGRGGQNLEKQSVWHL